MPLSSSHCMHMIMPMWMTHAYLHFRLLITDTNYRTYLHCILFCSQSKQRGGKRWKLNEYSMHCNLMYFVYNFPIRSENCLDLEFLIRHCLLSECVGVCMCDELWCHSSYVEIMWGFNGVKLLWWFISDLRCYLALLTRLKRKRMKFNFSKFISFFISLLCHVLAHPKLNK